MPLLTKKIPLLFLLIAFGKLLNAQNYHDSSLALATYKNILGTNMPLFIGSEYVDYNHVINGNPFFESLYLTNGDVVYNGIKHSNVKFFYDILHDDVVINNYNDTPLILVREKVSSFTLDGHNFQQVFADTSSKNNVRGFVDVLYDGEVKFIVKRRKIIADKPGQSFESFFSQLDEYYIFKNGNYNVVNSKNAALNILSDRKTELSKFIRQHKLKFRKTKESSLEQLVEYYDGLNNTK